MTGVDFSGVSLPFSAGDVLGAGVDLLGVVGGLVLLGIALAFTPKLIALVRTAVGSARNRA